MLRNVFTRSLREEIRGLIWWSAGLVALAAWVMALYPTYRKTAADLQRFYDKAPAAFRALFGGGDLASPEGFLRAEFFSIMVPLLLSIFAIGACARTIAGNERRGTLELLLAEPVERRQVLLGKALGVVASILLLVVILSVSFIVAGAATNMGVPPLRIAQATGATGLVGLVLGMIALSVGAATGSRGAAIAASSVVGVAGYLVDGLGQVVEGMRAFRPLSVFYHAGFGDPIRNGIDVGHAALLIGATVAITAIGAVLFDRRDIAV